MTAKVAAVRLFGQDMRVFDEVGGEQVIVPDYRTATDPTIHTVAIEFDNGYSVVVGMREGGSNEPFIVRLERYGEPVEGGRMSWSEQFEFTVPS